METQIFRGTEGNMSQRTPQQDLEQQLKDPEFARLYHAEQVKDEKRIARARLRAERKAQQKKERLTLTVDEVAEILGISKGLAFEGVGRGEIPAIRVGKRWLIPKIALERWLNNVTCEKTP